MTRMAGEVADGLFLHSFTTEAYIRGHTWPNFAAGLAAASRTAQDVRVCYWPFLVSGSNPEMFERARRAIAKRIAFYGSTPAYRPVLEQHGWAALQPRLQALTREGKWDAMAELITPEMLETVAVVGEPEQAAHILWQRYGDLVQDLVLASDVIDLPTLAVIARQVRACAG